jgi:hypothetical protein
LRWPELLPKLPYECLDVSFMLSVENGVRLHQPVYESCDVISLGGLDISAFTANTHAFGAIAEAGRTLTQRE